MLIEVITAPSGIFIWVDGLRDFSEFQLTSQNAFDGPATFFIFTNLIINGVTINRIDFTVNVLNEDPATISASLTIGGSTNTYGGSMTTVTKVVASPITLTNGQIITLDSLCVYYKGNIT